jgi:cation/acetate symporter
MPAEYALSNVWIGLGVVGILFAIFYYVGYIFPENHL